MVGHSPNQNEHPGLDEDTALAFLEAAKATSRASLRDPVATTAAWLEDHGYGNLADNYRGVISSRVVDLPAANCV
jgi:hypothetical protein